MSTDTAPPPPPATHPATLSVGDMTCAACARRVERALRKLPGVEEALVNLATEEAQVHYDTSQVKVRALKQAVVDAGYRIIEETEIDAAPDLDPIRTQRRALILAALFALPPLLLEMGGMAGLPLPEAVTFARHPLRLGLFQLAMVLPVAWIGRRLLGDGIRALLRGGPNMFSLIALGTGAAFSFSLVGLARVIGGEAITFHTYFPAASTIISLVLLGRYLENRSKAKAGEAIRALAALQPQTACLVEENNERAIATADIEVGDLLRVRPGEQIPTDGHLLEGHTSVDESLLTGESRPVGKKSGDQLIGGSLNQSGLLTMQATRIGRDTALARIVQLVEEAQRGQAPIARLADTISAFFVPLVLGLGLVAATAWLLAGAEWAFALEIFVAVLIIACPCSLGLATPAAIMVGTGRGAHLGILVKSPQALELTHRLDTLVLDKTGTITQGRAGATDLIALDDTPPDRWLALAAAVESGSEHPLAAALTRAASQRGLALEKVQDFQALPGRGVVGRVAGHRVSIGNTTLMQEQQAPLADHLQQAQNLARDGKTPVWIAVDGRPVGLAGIADAIRPDSPADLDRLRRMGLQTIMLTGDDNDTAQAIARQVGIDRVVAQVLPADKAKAVQTLQAEGRRVGMVGDGVNDAPALAQADIGLAIGAGTDVAAEAADIVLMNDRLADVGRAIRLSRAVMRTIRQNLFWAFFYNAAGVPIAAGVLYLFGGPLLNPMVASLAMAFSSVSVIANALRLRRFENSPAS
ncbi:MAG: heavy metal translocating P-type ATPase [Candidatus Latescibacteria bacterium]|nr:heavy metal translocating P-type ATPase [Candidatus Latescibacterota bacterium]